MSEEKLYTFRYTIWGRRHEEVIKFNSDQEAMTYAVEELPKKGCMDIQPPVAYDYLKKNKLR